MIISVRRGRDGRDYPVVMPPPADWRWQVIVLTHELCHERGMAIRQAQAELLSRGYRRSRGSVGNDLERRMPTCARCAAQAAGDG